MKIGVVKEIKNHEYRVALRPSGAEQLIADGHEVMVETLAGKGTSLGDDLYAAMQEYAGDEIGTDLCYDSHTYPYFFKDTNGDAE